MKPYLIVTLLLSLCSFSGRSQDKKTKSDIIKLTDKSLKKDFVEISGGAITYDIRGVERKEKDVARKTTFGVFYIAKAEVSVKQYADFMNANNGVYSGIDLKPSTDSLILFDGVSLLQYLSDKRYENYPIVGVSLFQAEAYCAWFTEEENKRLMAKKKPLTIKCILPNSLQLQASQLKAFNTSNAQFPKLTSEHLQQVEAISNFSVIEGVNNRPQEVKTHKAPMLPLYNITGNVAEWISEPSTEDTSYIQAIKKYRSKLKKPTIGSKFHIPDSIKPTLGIIQGGSYNIDKKFLAPDTFVVLPSNKGYTWVGFRPILYCTEVKKSSQKK